MIDSRCIHGRPLAGCPDCDTPTGAAAVYALGALVAGVLLLVLFLVWSWSA
jgi:hypothetical protein